MYKFRDAVFRLTDRLSVGVENLDLKAHGLTVLTGANGSGKSAVCRAIAGDLPLLDGSRDDFTAAVVSFGKQLELMEDDFNLRNSDALSIEEEAGIRVSDLLSGADDEKVRDVIRALDLESLTDRSFRTLSGGEGRRVLIARALCSDPDALVLDTPFDALDAESRRKLTEMLRAIKELYALPVVLCVNRADEIPDFADALGIVSELKIVKTGSVKEMLADDDVRSLLYAKSPEDVTLPAPPARFRDLRCRTDLLVDLRRVNVTYARPVLKDLSFRVRRGEHWQITGPNGAGKSTLLSLITGENPLLFANDVTVFGMRRGTGESIADVRRHFGLVSGALHMDYRVSAAALKIVLSGFYDSIGLYSRPSDDEIRVARQWLSLAGMQDAERASFQSLSFGRQRLLLIMRALVKSPDLLILDEPLQGLDACGRALVRAFLDKITAARETSVLFVSHHAEDAPRGITHRLSFRPAADGSGFDAVQERL